MNEEIINFIATQNFDLCIAIIIFMTVFTAVILWVMTSELRKVTKELERVKKELKRLK